MRHTAPPSGVPGPVCHAPAPFYSWAPSFPPLSAVASQPPPTATTAGHITDGTTSCHPCGKHLQHPTAGRLDWTCGSHLPQRHTGLPNARPQGSSHIACQPRHTSAAVKPAVYLRCIDTAFPAPAPHVFPQRLPFVHTAMLTDTRCLWPHRTRIRPKYMPGICSSTPVAASSAPLAAFVNTCQQVMGPSPLLPEPPLLPSPQTPSPRTGTTPLRPARPANTRLRLALLAQQPACSISLCGTPAANRQLSAVHLAEPAPTASHLLSASSNERLTQ